MKSHSLKLLVVPMVAILGAHVAAAQGGGGVGGRGGSLILPLSDSDQVRAALSNSKSDLMTRLDVWIAGDLEAGRIHDPKIQEILKRMLAGFVKPAHGTGLPGSALEAD